MKVFKVTKQDMNQYESSCLSDFLMLFLILCVVYPYFSQNGNQFWIVCLLARYSPLSFCE